MTLELFREPRWCHLLGSDSVLNCFRLPRCAESSTVGSRGKCASCPLDKFPCDLDLGVFRRVTWNILPLFTTGAVMSLSEPPPEAPPLRPHRRRHQYRPVPPGDPLQLPLPVTDPTPPMGSIEPDLPSPPPLPPEESAIDILAVPEASVDLIVLDPSPGLTSGAIQPIPLLPYEENNPKENPNIEKCATPQTEPTIDTTQDDFVALVEKCDNGDISALEVVIPSPPPPVILEEPPLELPVTPVASEKLEIPALEALAIDVPNDAVISTESSQNTTLLLSVVADPSVSVEQNVSDCFDEDEVALSACSLSTVTVHGLNVPLTLVYSEIILRLLSVD